MDGASLDVRTDELWLRVTVRSAGGQAAPSIGVLTVPVFALASALFCKPAGGVRVAELSKLPVPHPVKFDAVRL